jgi:hypothetical protein
MITGSGLVLPCMKVRTREGEIDRETTSTPEELSRAIRAGLIFLALSTIYLPPNVRGCGLKGVTNHC